MGNSQSYDVSSAREEKKAGKEVQIKIREVKQVKENAPSTLHATLIDTPEPKEVHSSMVAKNDIVTTESYVTQKMDELQVLKLTQPLPSVPLEVSPSQSQYDKLNK